jgi:phage shock protein PspC (stress-responsive transcriptional regulator)
MQSQKIRNVAGPFAFIAKQYGLQPDRIFVFYISG